MRLLPGINLSRWKNRKTDTGGYELHKHMADFEAIVRDFKGNEPPRTGNAELAYQLSIYLAAQDPREALDWIGLLQGIDGDYRARIDTLNKIAARRISRSCRCSVFNYRAGVGRPG
jgi:hypothetical protein